MNKKILLTIFALAVSICAGATNQIDKLIEQKIKQENLSLSALCDDATFIRRATLTLTGRLPKAERALSYIESTEANKKGKLLKELLASEAYIDYQVLKWGDLLRIKAEFPSNIWPNGVQAYNRWLKEQLTNNVPYDKMVYSLLTSSGSNFRSPAVNFFRAFQTRTPDATAENISVLFTGQRTAPDSFKNFFTQVRYKNTNEWKEEIVYVDLDINSPFSAVVMPDNKTLALADGRDHRQVFAKWLCSSENKLFAKVMANRVWYWLMGKGIISPPDDITEHSKASNEALLNYLESEFISSGFDIQNLFYLILSSDAFARSSLSNTDKEKGAIHFAYYPTIRLGSEQLLDAIGDITGKFDTYMSRTPEPYSYYPSDIRSVQLGDGSVTSAQIELFGRPSRDVSLESDRNNNLNSKQVLYLLNSAAIESKIRTSANIKTLANAAKSRQELIDNIYLMTLSRKPSTKEQQVILENTAELRTNSELAQHLVWALINSTEFLFNH